VKHCELTTLKRDKLHVVCTTVSCIVYMQVCCILFRVAVGVFSSTS